MTSSFLSISRSFNQLGTSFCGGQRQFLYQIRKIADGLQTRQIEFLVVHVDSEIVSEPDEDRHEPKRIQREVLTKREPFGKGPVGRHHRYILGEHTCHPIMRFHAACAYLVCVLS